MDILKDGEKAGEFVMLGRRIRPCDLCGAEDALYGVKDAEGIVKLTMCQGCLNKGGARE